MKYKRFLPAKEEVTPERLYLESLFGFRITNEYWTQVKFLFSKKGIVLSFDNLKLFHSANNRNQPSLFDTQLINDFEQISNTLKSLKKPFTGKEILDLIKDLGLKPSESTLSRWFKKYGGYKKTEIYCIDWTLEILLKAYQYKEQRPNNYETSQNLFPVN